MNHFPPKFDIFIIIHIWIRFRCAIYINARYCEKLTLNSDCHLLACTCSAVQKLFIDVRVVGQRSWSSLGHHEGALGSLLIFRSGELRLTASVETSISWAVIRHGGPLDFLIGPFVASMHVELGN